MKRLSVLVTRPQPEADATAARLARAGYEPLVAPMLQIVLAPPGEALDPGPVSAVIVTSLNGVRGLALRPDLPHLITLPVYAVGDATARAAIKVGFVDVRSAGGTAQDLVRLIRAGHSGSLPLLYVAGRDRTADLEAGLRGAGLRLIVAEVYRAEAVADLPDAVRARLEAGSVDRILVYSERTAKAFAAAVKGAGLIERCRDIAIHAISARAAAPLAEAGFRALTVAASADSDALIASLPPAG